MMPDVGLQLLLGSLSAKYLAINMFWPIASAADMVKISCLLLGAVFIELFMKKCAKRGDA